MAFFQWSKELEINVAELDEQHRFLVGLINEFYEAMLAGKGREVLDDVMTCLLSYVNTHFQAEEQLMTESAFPGRDAHVGEHKALQAKVEDLIEESRKCNRAISVKVGIFLKDWLREHIMKSDQELARHISRS